MPDAITLLARLFRKEKPQVDDGSLAGIYINKKANQSSCQVLRESDIEDIVDLEMEYLNVHFTVSRDVRLDACLKLMRLNPQCYRGCRDSSGKLVAYSTIIPLTASGLERYYSGAFTMHTRRRDDIAAPEDKAEVLLLYSVVVSKPSRATDGALWIALVASHVAAWFSDSERLRGTKLVTAVSNERLREILLRRFGFRVTGVDHRGKPILSLVIGDEETSSGGLHAELVLSALVTEQLRSRSSRTLGAPKTASSAATAEPSSVKANQVGILFLASNPHATTRLTLDEEARDIQAKLRAAENRERFTMRSCWAVRPDDLLQVLNECRPLIVHFSGHGFGEPGIVLHDDSGGAQTVTSQGLRALFAALKNEIRVVVLNACYSAAQADAIVEEIDCVVAMADAVGDVASRKFAASFYRALAFGASVQNAFDQGLAALALEGLALDHAVPRLITRNGVVADRIFIAPT